MNNRQQLINLLNDLGIEGNPPQYADEWNTVCPLHGARWGGGTNFGINLRKGKFRCLSAHCGQAGNIEWLIKKLGGDIEFGISKSLDQLLDELDKEREQDPSYVYLPPDVSELSKWRYLHPSLLERGFDKAFLIKNHIGYNPECHRSTIPVFDQQKKYWGTTTRAVIDDDHPKYRNPPGMPKSKFVYVPYHYELDENSHLIVCEGQLNALMATQHGHLGAACLGSEPSKEQVEQILRLARTLDLKICLWYDNDMAGLAATNEFLKHAPSDLVEIVDWANVPKDINDVCDCAQNNIFEQVLSSRKDVFEWILTA